MRGALRILATGLASQQYQIEVIANNIANLQTPGFKKTRVEFKDLPYRKPPQVEAGQGTARLVQGVQGEGVAVSASQILMSQGQLQPSDNLLDLALEGQGFFPVQLRDGSLAYTRDGGFGLDEQRRIVNREGLPLVPDITIPEGMEIVRIEEDGTIVAQAADGEPENVGQIVVARFPNAEGLAPIGHNLFVPTVASGGAVTGAPSSPGYGTLQAGMLEQANVNLAEEMTRLLQAQRAYQLGLQALRAWDEIVSRANNLRR